MDLTHGLRAPLATWLLGAAPVREGMPVLFPAFCDELVRAGLPIWRASLGLETLHPEASGFMLVWRDGALTREEPRRAGVLTSEPYLRSPIRVVDETGQPFRRRLAQEGTGGFPVLEDLVAEDATDYAVLPLLFVDTSRTAVNSFATKAPTGFSEEEMRALDEAYRLLSPYAERALLRRIAIDLLAAYLGRAAGRRVYEGRVERGDVETLEAAIWFCDLRGFTALAEHLPRREVIALLNRWFDAVGGAVVAEGGEILKFMGDGFLAVFLVDGEPDIVCDRALAAAEAAVAASRGLDREVAREGRAPLRFGLALHLGEVEFGNIGTHDRLDFTVMGPAVNHASRLEALTKELQAPILASAAFAMRVSRPMRPLGRFVLRGIAGEVEVYAPGAGDSEAAPGGI
jgi:adenylate cyclase